MPVTIDTLATEETKNPVGLVAAFFYFYLFIKFSDKVQQYYYTVITHNCLFTLSLPVFSLYETTVQSADSPVLAEVEL